MFIASLLLCYQAKLWTDVSGVGNLCVCVCMYFFESFRFIRLVGFDSDTRLYRLIEMFWFYFHSRQFECPINYYDFHIVNRKWSIKVQSQSLFKYFGYIFTIFVVLNPTYCSMLSIQWGRVRILLKIGDVWQKKISQWSLTECIR